MLSGPGAVEREERRALLNSAKVNSLLYVIELASGVEKHGVCVDAW